VRFSRLDPQGEKRCKKRKKGLAFLKANAKVRFDSH
jgi:hypothetical protein